MQLEALTPLARGGMGVVERARTTDGRDVVVKRIALMGTTAERDVARRRLEREAEVLASLDHPNIVPLLDVIRLDGDLALVLPYLTGGSLADRLRADGVVPADEVRAMVEPLLDALASAHRAGIVHRDVVPSNVLFDGDGRPVLADFGLARHRHATHGLTGDSIIGTPAYLAPEIARGGEAGPSTDAFGLGATLWAAVAGQGPWGRGRPEVLVARAVEGKRRRLPRSLPDDLAGVIDDLTQPRADQRPTPAELLGGVDGTMALSAARRGRRRTMPAVVVAALVAGAVGVGAAGLAGAGPERPTPSKLVGPDPVPVEKCRPQPYQQCGEDPAPNTDGAACLTGFADYDGDATNGCEAVPRGPEDGERLVRTLRANLVPADDVDRFLLDVDDRFQLTCNGAVRITLVAPPGVAQRVEVLRGDDVVGSAASADGQPAVVEVGDPRCMSDDSETLEVVVSTVSGLTDATYSLSARGAY